MPKYLTRSRQFQNQRDNVRFEEETTQEYKEAHRRNLQRPKLDKAASAELKKLYRELARRFHPDLARTEEERWRSESIMQRINAAFQAKDLVALQRLSQEAAIEDPSFEQRSLGDGSTKSLLR
jgi:hypothetical protein